MTRKRHGRRGSGRFEILHPLPGLPEAIRAEKALRWGIFVRGSLRWEGRQPYGTVMQGAALTEAVGWKVGTVFSPDAAPQVRKLDDQDWVVTTWRDLPVGQEDLQSGFFVCRTNNSSFDLRLGDQAPLRAGGKRGAWYRIPLQPLLSSTEVAQLRAFGGRPKYRWDARAVLISGEAATTTTELWFRLTP